jgi:hypothetical protein
MPCGFLQLATAPPLCLEPDVKVGLVANVLNYNKCKYNLTRTAKRKILSASDARGEKAAMPKKGGVRCATIGRKFRHAAHSNSRLTSDVHAHVSGSFALMDFLTKKNYRPSQSGHDNDTLPLNRKPLKDMDKTKKGDHPLQHRAYPPRSRN